MEPFHAEDFKISGQIVNKKEKEFLKSLGFRWCAKCQSAKLEREFYPTQWGCISCCKTTKNKWLDKNPLYFENYRKTHKAQQSKAHKDWFLRNKEKKNQQNKDWYYSNKEKKKIKQLEWRRKQSATNLKYKIAKCLRQRIRGAIIKGYKSASTFNLLGCSLEELIIHLESQFTEGMSWENYGNPNGNHSNCWHIDHIKPCASFNLLDPEEQKKCFHYTNLQPLWGIDNIKKGKSVS